jgi:UDP-N-acetylmuramate--alanine ligase
MDTYGHDVAKLKSAFVEFTQRLPFYGSASVCSDDANVREILPFVSRPVITYGINPDAQVRATNVRAPGTRMKFDVERQTRHGALPKMSVELNLPGLHNVLNALAAIAVATELGVDDVAIASALSGFRGVGRRFTQIGDFKAKNGGMFSVIDDYGHHPTEIKATLKGAKNLVKNHQLICVFQPVPLLTNPFVHAS